MDEINYHRVLFDTAMLVMACDGEIHKDEIQEMERAFKQSAIFRGLDFHSELDRVLNELHEDVRKAIDDYFIRLERIGLDPVQKLQVLEIVLRIMYADDRVEENELRFLQLVKDKLDVADEIIFRRFGDIGILRDGIDAEERQIQLVNKLVSGFNLPPDEIQPVENSKNAS